MEARHDTVLLTEAVEALALGENTTVVDATLGGAGHFAAILRALGASSTLVGIDADAEAVERARAIYAEDRRTDRPVTHLINDNFRNLAHVLERLSLGQIDAALFDLGWSGFQIAAPRGFSFQEDTPLLMTYGEGGETAADVLNSSSETDLADLIYHYGEERFARRIAKAVVEARAKEKILTTSQLVAVIESATPRWYHHGKTHPATKTFQALRIAANDEFGAIKEGLAAALAALAPGGRLAVITFHSLEDRLVKNILREAVESGQGTLEPKKPITPSRRETLANRRARSAKLRVYVRDPVAHANTPFTTLTTPTYA